MPISCAVCGDSGWAEVEAQPYASVTVAACECIEGEKRAAVRYGNRSPKRLRECMAPECLQALFPEGTAAAAREAARARLLAAGLPTVCREWTVTSYREIVIAGDKDLARFGHWADAWIETAADDRHDVVLYGTKGTGKTGLAVAMARGAFDKGATIRFTTARDLMQTFRASMRDDGEGEQSVDASFLAPQVLVLDEFGGTTLTDYQRDTLTALIDKRQKERRQTLITLNVEGGLLAEDVQAQTRELLGGRLADRLVEGALWWAMVGKSRRKPRRVRAYDAGGADASR